MSGPPAQNRKPYEPTPYAALRGGAVEPPAAMPSTLADDQSPRPSMADYFSLEAERLGLLREALWAAFAAGPDAGMPVTLIELTIAHTNALRLQLNLRGFSGKPTQSTRGLAVAPRGKV